MALLIHTVFNSDWGGGGVTPKTLVSYRILISWSNKGSAFCGPLPFPFFVQDLCVWLSELVQLLWIYHQATAWCLLRSGVVEELCQYWKSYFVIIPDTDTFIDILTITYLLETKCVCFFLKILLRLHTFAC